MRNFFRLGLLIVLAASLNGCATSSNETSGPSLADKVGKFVDGKTSYDEVIAVLGNPADTTINYNTEVINDFDKTPRSVKVVNGTKTLVYTDVRRRTVNSASKFLGNIPIADAFIKDKDLIGSTVYLKFYNKILNSSKIINPVN